MKRDAGGLKIEKTVNPALLLFSECRGKPPLMELANS